MSSESPLLEKSKGALTSFSAAMSAILDKPPSTCLRRAETARMGALKRRMALGDIDLA